MKVVALLVFLSLSATVLAQIPIPSKPYGYAQGSSDAPVVFEAFVDLLCPGSQASWPTINQVFEYYGPTKMRFVVHIFTLPIIHNSFFANQGARVIEKYVGSEAVLSWANVVFPAQESFWTANTANMTAAQVINALADLAQSSNLMSANDFLSGMNDSSTSAAAFNSWKYACARFVSDTPTFFVNGVLVDGDSSWTLQDWQMIFDPLYAPSKACSTLASPRSQLKDGQCPSGETVCNYLPGKTMCCMPGEFCIPNVGCSC